MTGILIFNIERFAVVNGISVNVTIANGKSNDQK